MRLVHTWKGDFLCEQFSRPTVYKIVEPLQLTYDSFELSDDSFLQMSWNPSNDWAVLVPFGELYALTHTIQRIDAHASRGSREPVRSDSCRESGPPKVTCAG
jgi:hypothetical protein